MLRKVLQVLVLVVAVCAAVEAEAFVERGEIGASFEADRVGANAPAWPAIVLDCDLCVAGGGIPVRGYANGNPLRYVDPTGEASCAVDAPKMGVPYEVCISMRNGAVTVNPGQFTGTVDASVVTADERRNKGDPGLSTFVHSSDLEKQRYQHRRMLQWRTVGVMAAVAGIAVAGPGVGLMTEAGGLTGLATGLQGHGALMAAGGWGAFGVATAGGTASGLALEYAATGGVTPGGAATSLVFGVAGGLAATGPLAVTTSGTAIEAEQFVRLGGLRPDPVQLEFAFLKNLGSSVAPRVAVSSPRFLGLPGGGLIDVTVPEVTVQLRYVPGMSRVEFARKADALRSLGEKGFLHRAVSPVARDRAVVRAFRQQLIRKIWAQYGQGNTAFANALIQRVTTRMQPDHVWELQLSGPDTEANLRMLDAFTNWHVGTQQLAPQLRNVAPGTRVQVEIVGGN